MCQSAIHQVLWCEATENTRKIEYPSKHMNQYFDLDLLSNSMPIPDLWHNNGSRYVMNRGYKGLHYTIFHPCPTHNCAYILSVGSALSLRSHCWHESLSAYSGVLSFGGYELKSVTKIRQRLFSSRTSTVSQQHNVRWWTAFGNGHEHNAHCSWKSPVRILSFCWQGAR